jgi:hypothetical protein
MREEVFYKHGRQNIFHKDYTVCGKVVEIVTQSGPGDDYSIVSYELHIGIAVCHDEDTFTKKVGTSLAFERASTNPILKIALKGDRSYMQYKTFVDNFIPEQALYTKIIVDTVLSNK